MSLTYSKMLEIGTKLPDFELVNTINHKIFNSKDLSQGKGKIIMFICNHCPYVVHYHEQIIAISNKYRNDLDFIAISSNDAATYPQDSPERMRELAIKLNFNFPYLYDEAQDVAKKYQAACTPEFYLFNKDDKLIYRGRMDDSSPDNGREANGLELLGAIDNFISNGDILVQQYPSMGCNIK